MTRKVVVVGWGAAGLAAAYAASSRGASVTVVGRGAGATSLYAGAVDDIDWSERESAATMLGQPLVAGPLEEEVRAFCAALNAWDLPGAGAPLPRLAATSGIVRSARGRDRALLELGALAGRAVLVPRAPRATWDADALVRSLRAGATLGATFEPIGAPVLRFADEARIPDADLAARHDEDARLDWLAARIAPFVEKVGRARCAVLLGPWLGVTAGRAGALEARLGCPVGEAMLTGSLVPGLRFEAARDEWLQKSGIGVVKGRAVGIEATPRGVVVLMDGQEPVEGDAVVLATGGLVGGGLVYDPPEHGAEPEGPEHVRAPFRLGLDVAGARVIDGSAPGITSSIFGPVLDHAWPRPGAPGALERAGVLAGTDGRCAPNVFAAGDVVAGARRTLLEAVHAGIAAGARAVHKGTPPFVHEGVRGGEIAAGTPLEAEGPYSSTHG